MYRFMSHCKIQANGESDHLRIFFFIYVRDLYERKLTKKFFSKILFHTHFMGMKSYPQQKLDFKICSKSQL